MRLARLAVGGVELDVELFDTPCAGSIYDLLPLEAPFNTWGDEFYFPVPFQGDLDGTATTRVRVGDIGYWPPGGALAVFFGPTPASTSDDPVPASEVNLVGRIRGDATLLRRAADARVIKMKRI
ncbi:MAG: cyclophilin-like fold protein [Nitrospirota bacterium]|jgi:hypothetical protein